MPKRAVFERSRRELSLDESVGVHTLLVVEQSSQESQSRECAKISTPTLTHKMIVCLGSVHVCMVIKYSKSKDQRVGLSILLVVSHMNESNYEIVSCFDSSEGLGAF